MFILNLLFLGKIHSKSHNLKFITLMNIFFFIFFKGLVTSFNP